MNDSDVEDALIILRASVIVMIARKSDGVCQLVEKHLASGHGTERLKC
jgi:hypothetical protein